MHKHSILGSGCILFEYLFDARELIVPGLIDSPVPWRWSLGNA
jgi:hypothetical protein